MIRKCTNPNCRHEQDYGRFCRKCGYETVPEMKKIKTETPGIVGDNYLESLFS